MKQRFGNRLRTIRQRNGLTQSGLAELVGLTEEYIGKIERGKASPSFTVITNLAEALEQDIVSLFLEERCHCIPTNSINNGENWSHQATCMCVQPDHNGDAVVECWPNAGRFFGYNEDVEFDRETLEKHLLLDDYDGQREVYNKFIAGLPVLHYDFRCKHNGGRHKRCILHAYTCMNQEDDIIAVATLLDIDQL